MKDRLEIMKTEDLHRIYRGYQTYELNLVDGLKEHEKARRERVRQILFQRGVLKGEK